MSGKVWISLMCMPVEKQSAICCFPTCPCRYHKLPESSSSAQQSARARQQEARKHHEERLNSFHTKAAALAESYGNSMQPALSNEHLEAPLHGKQLRLQADAAFELLSEAAKVNKDTAQFWHSINSTVDLRNKVSEWCKLASIALVQVPGSVEEERLFSKLAYIKDERRNSLDGEHLNAYLMLVTQRIWDLHTFPYNRAMGKWAVAKERRLAVHGRKHQQQGRQEQSAAVQLDSDSDWLEDH